jgi:hypothetical protein
VGHCHKCLSLSRKSIYAIENPDCRAVPFKDAPRGKKNLVEMAKAGGCYEDNPADFVHFMGMHSLHCYGFAKNYDECNEQCPFDVNSMEAEARLDKNFTVFGDSKC